MAPVSGLLFVDDDPENVETLAAILREALSIEVRSVQTVEDAVLALHERPWDAVVMDLFIPLGDHPDRVLGPRARRYQDQVEHLGGLVLLEEIERVVPPPLVITHTACNDYVLLELFKDRVAARIPKPAPMETLLVRILEVLRA